MKNLFNPMYIFLPFVLVFTVWLFLPGLNTPFLFDDWQVLVHSPWAADHGDWFLGYRPLRNLSYVIDLFFGKMEPFTFHVSNLVYHLLNIVLFTFLAKLIIIPNTQGRWLLLMGLCIVFAVHPVQIESVVYISGRRDLLFSFFYLAGLLFFFTTYQSRQLSSGWFGSSRFGSSRSGLAWAGLFVFTSLSTLSKESGITLPVTALILKPWIITLQDKNIQEKSVAKLIKSIKLRSRPFYLAMVAVIVFLLLLSAYTLGMAMPVLKTGFMGDNLFLHLMNCSNFIFRYFFIAVWPINLAIDNSRQSFDIISYYGDAGGLWALLAVSLLTGISLATRFGFLSHSKLAKDPDFNLIIKGWLWFIIIILPMSNIIPHVERFAVHYLYLPIPGIFMMIWGILSGIFKNSFGIYQKLNIKYYNQKQIPSSGKAGFKGTPGPAILVSAILVIVMSVGFSARTRYELQWWQEDLVFWEHTTTINPNCARAQTNYGMTLLKYNKSEEAAQAFNKSLAVHPTGFAYLGVSSIALDNHEIQKAKELLEFVPKNNHLLERYRLFIEGLIALSENRQNRALEIGERLHKVWPNDDAGYFLKAKIALNQKKYDDAIALLKESLALHGRHTRNYLEIIRVLIKARLWEQALTYLEKGFELELWEKDDANRLNDMGYTKDMLGQTQKAIKLWQKSLKSDAACIMAALNLSSALFRQKKYNDIIELQNHVNFSMDTDNKSVSRLLNNVGLAYIHKNQLDKARTIMKKALDLWPNNQGVISNLKRLDSMNN